MHSLAFIVASELTKDYRVPQRPPGIVGALRSLVNPAHRTVRAVDHVSFQVEPGETVGYIGLNGAGKSTTVKLLAGIIAPSGGSVRVGGLDPHSQRVANARRIGLVFGQRSQLLWDLPVRESFHLLRHIYRVDARRFEDNVRQFFTLLDLEAVWEQPVRLLSLGQKMRCELAAAFLHDPSVAYLDEPTIGLDVLAKTTVRRFLRQLAAERRVTVFLTTHDLRDVEEICGRILLIHQGRLSYDGPLRRLLAEYGREARLTVELEDEATVEPPPGTRLAARDGRRWVLVYDRGRHRVPELIAALSRLYPLRDVTTTDLDLEGVVRRVYGGEAP